HLACMALAGKLGCREGAERIQEPHACWLARTQPCPCAGHRGFLQQSLSPRIMHSPESMIQIAPHLISSAQIPEQATKPGCQRHFAVGGAARNHTAPTRVTESAPAT